MSALSAREFHDEATAHTRLERIIWPKGPVCPKCHGHGQDRITPVKGGRVGLYRCGPCKRQFTVKVGTVFESSHGPLNQWFQVVYMMVGSKKGVSSHQVMRTLDCQYKTAWFMTHRIREAMKTTRGRTVGSSAGQARRSRPTKPSSEGRPRTGPISRNRRSRQFSHWLNEAGQSAAFTSRT